MILHAPARFSISLDAALKALTLASKFELSSSETMGTGGVSLLSTTAIRSWSSFNRLAIVKPTMPAPTMIMSKSLFTLGFIVGYYSIEWPIKLGSSIPQPILY